MNIVYKFTSTNTGRFYIGSKAECEVIDGIIIDKNGKTYYSSSTSPEFWKDLQTYGMTLEVLEVVSDTGFLLEREEFYQKKYNSIESDIGYNKIYANSIRTSITKERLDSDINKFGESLRKYMNNNSVFTRKDNKAKSLGFSNYGEMVYFALIENSNGKSLSKIDAEFNQNGYFKRIVKEKSLNDIIDFDSVSLVKLLLDGASFLKACELVGVSDWVARRHYGDELPIANTRLLRIAIENGFDSKKDLVKHIIVRFLEGDSRTKISEGIKGASISSICRVIDNVFRSVVKINDLD